jgi:hypothetical protein
VVVIPLWPVSAEEKWYMDDNYPPLSVKITSKSHDRIFTGAKHYLVTSEIHYLATDYQTLTISKTSKY